MPPVRIYHNLIRYKNVAVLPYYEIRGTAQSETSFSPYNYVWNDYCLVNGSTIDLCKYEVDSNHVFYGTYGGYDYFEFTGTIYDNLSWDNQEQNYYYYDNNNNKVYVDSYCSRVFDENGQYTPINDINEYLSNIPSTISFDITYIDLDTRETTSVTENAIIDENNEWSIQYPKTQKIYAFSHTEQSGDSSGSEVSNEGLITIDFTDADNFSEFVNGSNMFQGNSMLESVDFSQQNFSNMTNAYSMFEGCSSLNSIVWSVNNTFNSLEYAEYMFDGYNVDNTEIAMIYQAMNRVSSVLETDWEDICMNFELDGIYYKIIANDEVEITNGSGCSGDVEIPDSITKGVYEFDVTGLSYHAFSGNYNITSVSLNDVITEIGSNCFYDCGNLESVDLKNVITIDNYAFENCNSLETLTIPSSVTTIGYSAFAYCSSIESLTIPSSVISIGSDAFSNINDLNYLYINTNADLSESGLMVKKDNVFYAIISRNEAAASKIDYYSNADTITIKSSLNLGNIYNVYTINEEAFYYETSLKYVTIQEGLKYIRKNAFKNSGLITISIPNSIEVVEEDVFANCNSLTYTTEDHCNYLGNSNNNYVVLVSANLYEGSGNSSQIVTSLSINQNCRIIYNKAFHAGQWQTYSGASYYTGHQVTGSLSLPNVVYIGKNAFNNCLKLTSVTLGSGLKIIESGAFKNCHYMDSPTLPSSLTTIGSLAFSETGRYVSTSFYSITIPSSVTSIGTNAFEMVKAIFYYGTATGANWGATYLNPVYEDGVIYVDNVLTDCLNPTDLVIKSGTTKIKDSALKDCTTLTSVVIPSSVTSIERYAFMGCTSLQSVTLPNTTIGLDNGVFYDCSSLQSIDLSKATLLNTTSFLSGCTQLTTVVLPNNITTLGQSMFFGCTSLTNVTIPSSVTTISNAAFYQCSSLGNLTIPSSVTTIGSSAFTGAYIQNVNFESIESLCSIQFGDYAANPFYVATNKLINNQPIVNVTIPNTITSLKYTFVKCTTLESVIIPSSVTTIGNSTFEDCTALQSVTIPSSVTTIGSYAFSGCSSLDNLTIPTSVITMGNAAFSGCTSLSSIEINPSLKKVAHTGYTEVSCIIPEGLFYNCTSLTSVTIRTNGISDGGVVYYLKEIEYHAFSNCTLLHITIPTSVRTINYDAFTNVSMANISNLSSFSSLSGYPFGAV